MTSYTCHNYTYVGKNTLLWGKGEMTLYEKNFNYKNISLIQKVNVKLAPRGQ